MSVIVTHFPSRTMASDSQINSAGVRLYAQPKIRRIRGALVATVGDAADGLAFWHWYESGGRIGENPELGDGFAAVVMTEAGVFEVEQNCYPDRIPSGVSVIGSGRDVALGALAAGASPEGAVAIACEIANDCGPPVVIERL